MSGSTIPTIPPDGFAARIADLFPRGWASDDAKQPGGTLYAVLLALATQLQTVQGQLQYALDAQRLNSETFPELDNASIDFFGGGLPRQPGVSDAQFGAQIIATLFRTAATRSALQAALTALTGYVPRMMEPWDVNDTGAWRAHSYWNVDTVVDPARWGSGLRYQGFVETASPALPAIGPNNPILTWGTAYWNIPGYFFGIIAPVNINAIDDLINSLRAYGTIVWTKIVSTGILNTATAPSQATALAASPAGTNSVFVSWHAPTVGTPPLFYTIAYRQSGVAAYSNGPTGTATSGTVSGLAPNTSYDFQIITRNQGGASTSTTTVSAMTNKVPPSPAGSLTATVVQANAVTLTWTAPTSGSPPYNYSVNYMVVGAATWQNLIVGQGALTVTVINLLPNTNYQFEVITSNL